MGFVVRRGESFFQWLLLEGIATGEDGAPATKEYCKGFCVSCLNCATSLEIYASGLLCSMGAMVGMHKSSPND